MDRPKPPSGRRPRRPPVPLDSARLEELALAYVGRFAVSAGRLRGYCARKLRERGHAGAEEGAPAPDIDALVGRFVANGYIDDAGYARVRASGLLRRGYGARRVGEALRVDGIADDLRAVVEPGEAARREAAAACARRRRLGPYARAGEGGGDPRTRDRHLAAILRAGHDIGHARHVLDAATVGDLEEWIAEAREKEDQSA